MMLLLGVAFLSGMATIISPCVLPVLPVVLASSVAGGRWRPLGVTVGLAASFALVTLAFSAILDALRLPPDALRAVGIVVIGLAGLSLLIPQIMVRLEGLLTRVGQLGLRMQGSGAQRGGFGGGLLLGAALGLVWTPCAGPILAAVIATAALQGASPRAAAVVLAYAVGAGLPMMAIAFGGQWMVRALRRTGRYAAVAQQALGALVLLTAVAMAADVDRQFQLWAVAALPAEWNTPLLGVEAGSPIRHALGELRGQTSHAAAQSAPPTTAAGAGPVPDLGQQIAQGVSPTPLSLDNLGPAPKFKGITRWLNTAHPLNLSALRGKVVLIDLWTYSCINCLRTLPHVRDWYATYRAKGFVVIGVHTPEFSFERVPANVARATRQLGITYPVALDNAYATWQAYNNEYWPAEYLIDARGRIRHTHFGEGEYDVTERAIQALLREAGRPVASVLTGAPDLTPTHDQTPETYIGRDRMTNFASPQGVASDQARDYTTPPTLRPDSFALAGRWWVQPNAATAMRPGASLDFAVRGSKVFVVLAPHGRADRVRVLLDGQPVRSGLNVGADAPGGVVRVTMDNLYNVVDLRGKVESHRLRLIFDQPGTQVYAFTFG